MHAPLDWWTDEKIEYYVRASRSTSFHRDLSSRIEAEIDRKESILELGAGLGYVTEILNNDGYCIKGIEKSSKAADLANKRAGKALIDISDAFSVREKRDVVLMIFFGMIHTLEDLDYFLSLSNRKVIYIISRHKGNIYSQKKDRRMEMKAILDESGYSYRIVDFTSDFSQPLKDAEDAKAYFSLSYGSKAIPHLEENNDEKYPLLFRNRKQISMFIINKRGGKE